MASGVFTGSELNSNHNHVLGSSSIIDRGTYMEAYMGITRVLYMYENLRSVYIKSILNSDTRTDLVLGVK